MKNSQKSQAQSHQPLKKRFGFPVKLSSGFTLIELLVVIAIIGMLSSVVLASLSSARVKSRDVRRVADMDQIRNAVELYNNDNGHYPNTGGAWSSFDAPGYMGTAISSPNAANLTAALSAYFPSPPTDPKRTAASDSGYLYISDGTNYCILIYLTPENLNNFARSLIPATRCTAWNSAGVCTSGVNALYLGVGTYSGGC